ncbi:MAG: hypothetical protein LC676_10780 [Loktanella sp.]|nr:hypothetical protein [Loktanella sp.]
MAFQFPRSNSRLAEHITPAVEDALAEWRRLPTRTEAAVQARNFFASTTTGATGVYSVCLLADDSVALCRFGVRRHFRVIWRFGRGD